MDEEKLAEMLRMALAQCYVLNTPDNGLEFHVPKQAALELANAINAAAYAAYNDTCKTSQEM